MSERSEDNPPLSANLYLNPRMFVGFILPDTEPSKLERGRGEDETKRRSRKVLIKLEAPTLRDHENNPPLSTENL